MMHKIYTSFLCLLSFFACELSAATILTVNSNLDSAVGTGGTGVGTTGDLRYVLNLINQAPNAYQVNFNLPAGQETISVQGMIPVLNQNAANTLLIDGSNTSGSGVNVRINGGGSQRGFIAEQGPINIQNMTIENTSANGGMGGVGKGGGGLGAGGALFINQAQVVLSNVNMVNNVARGGNGGIQSGVTASDTAGGGGMGGNGGSLGKAGGGGLGGNGGSDPLGTNPAGGGGVAPGGNGGSLGGAGAAGGSFGSAEAGDAANGTAGGANGGGGGSGIGVFNGGGGGINGLDGTLATGGNGGYGGGGAGHFGNGGFGGGGGSNGDGGFGGGGGSDGDGGFGGGGGGSTTTPGTGGVGGGQGAINFGGPGAGLGGGIFINSSNQYAEGGGSLEVQGNSNFESNNAIAGQGATPLAQNGAAAGGAIFATSGHPITFNPGVSNQIVINGSIGDDSANTLTGNGYTPGTAEGVSIIKKGVGTLTLLGTNTFAGKVDLQSGILQIDKDAALGKQDVSLEVNGAAILEGLASFSSSRPIQLNDTLTFNTNINLIDWNGLINGIGGIKKTGMGALILSHMNNTGQVDVLEGELVVKNDHSRFVTNNFSVSTGSELSLEQERATIGIYTGTFSGTGVMNINKFGSGGVIGLTGNSPFFIGTTIVHRGVLGLEGMLGGNIIVGPATLIGQGTALSNVYIKNQGRIAPGLGKFTIEGSLIQETGSAYLSSFSGDKNSLLDIKKTAFLEPGSSLEIFLHDCPNINNLYQILTAAEGVNGQYTNIFMLNNDVLDPFVVYDLNNAYVYFKTGFLRIAETINQKQIAEQLASLGFNLPPELQKILQDFCPLNAFGVRNSLDQLSGIQFTTALLVADTANRQFTRRIFDPLRPMIVANPCAPYVYCTYKPTFDLWASTTGGASFYQEDKKVKGFHVGDFAFTVGGQYQLYRQLTIGGAITVENDCLSYKVGGSAKNNATLVGFYSLYRPRGFYVFGDVNFGHHSFKIKRNIDLGQLHFKPKSTLGVNQVAGYLEIGTDFGLNAVLLQPFVAIEMGSARFDSFKEHTGSPLDLAVKGKSWNNSASRIGVHLSSAPLLNGLSMAVDLSWNYRLGFQRNFIFEKFKDFGTQFKIKGISLQRNSFEANVFFSQQLNKCWTLYFEGNALGWQKAFAFNFTGGVLLTW